MKFVRKVSIVLDEKQVKELLHSVVPLVNMMQCTSEFSKRLDLMLSVFTTKQQQGQQQTPRKQQCWICLIILIVVMVS